MADSAWVSCPFASGAAVAGGISAFPLLASPVLVSLSFAEPNAALESAAGPDFCSDIGCAETGIGIWFFASNAVSAGCRLWSTAAEMARTAQAARAPQRRRKRLREGLGRMTATVVVAGGWVRATTSRQSAQPAK